MLFKIGKTCSRWREELLQRYMGKELSAVFVNQIGCQMNLHIVTLMGVHIQRPAG